MTSISLDFRVYLKNIFVLEPLLKLATFVVEEVISQSVKKKVKESYPPPLKSPPPTKGPKNRKFFQNRYFSHIKFTKNMFKDFFGIPRHQMII
jgi:hypothetical protein